MVTKVKEKKMSYKCCKCGKEIGQVVSYQGEDYCYHCADKFIDYPKKFRNGKGDVKNE